MIAPSSLPHAPVGATSRRRRVLLARAGWLGALATMLAVLIAYLPAYTAQMRTTCFGTACEYEQLTPEQVRALAGIGLTLDGYIALTLVILFAVLVVAWTVSALIMWRRSDDLMAALVAVLLLMFGPIQTWVNLQPARSLLWGLSVVLTIGFTALFLLVFLLFPSGRFIPRWMRWVYAVLVIGQSAALLVPTLPVLGDTAVGKLGWLSAVVTFVFAMVSQVYRFLRVSTGNERQQTKWVVLGVAASAAAAALITALAIALPPVAGQRTSAFGTLATNEYGFLLGLFISLAFGLAMSRSRLWDIDVLINRTLVYGALVLILTGVFVGVVIGLQALLGGFIGQDNSLAVVASTLLIAALFQPLRRRVRLVIDQRFYRRKYDAVRTLERFGETLRAEVDLQALRQHLLEAVEETMQPAHVSLWLRPRGERPPAAERPQITRAAHSPR
ncbi:MAG TPA: hypothetical protein VGR57_05915 [Ktedonobacterales bacterium]|nr:hypothetical protein [Ktedonobacterales bacterium]